MHVVQCVHVVQRREGPAGGASEQAAGPAVRLRERRVSGEFWAGGLRGGRWGCSGPGGGPGTQWGLLLPRFCPHRRPSVPKQARPSTSPWPCGLRAGLWLQKPFLTPDLCPELTPAPLGGPSGQPCAPGVQAWLGRGALGQEKFGPSCGP